MTELGLFYHDNGEPAAKPYHYLECGLDNVFLANGFELTEFDGDQYVSISDVDHLWRAIAMNLVLSQKLLSPKEIRFLRGQMDYTQAKLGELLGVEDQTVARWEKGQVTLPGPADRAIRIFYLASDAAGAEGQELLRRIVDLVQELVNRDTPVAENVLFSKTDDQWQPELAIAC